MRTLKILSKYANTIGFYLNARIAFIFALVFFYSAAPLAQSEPVRVVSLGGEITEMIVLLGLADNIVAVDTTSTWPEKMTQLPQVGYLRALSAEGVLSMSPTVIVSNEEAGPHSVVQQIKSSGVTYHTIPKAKDFQAVADNVRQLGKILARETKAAVIAGEIEAEAANFLQRKAIKTAKDKDKPTVIFLLSAGTGAPMVSGTNTAADAMIKLAGGINVMTSYEGYRAVSADAILAKQPDVILMTSRTLKALGGKQKVLSLPGLSKTPAALNNRLVSLDGMYMLGFGPRVVSAAHDLADLIH